MKYKIIIVIISFSFLQFLSCSKSDPLPSINGDVYVAGTELDGTHFSAKYWKNGVGKFLTHDGIDSEAHAVTVSGEDVYIAGYMNVTDVNIGYKYIPMYWKNEVAVSMKEDGVAYSIAVSGSDVYLSGHLGRGIPNAAYWKNGIMVPLYKHPTYGSIAYSIIINNNDIYIAGYEGIVAKYWKNDVAHTLTDSTYEAAAQSIFISGTDIYVAGQERNADGIWVAKYWKNGSPNVLTNGNNHAFANSIVVIGNDVYVAGYEDVDSGKSGFMTAKCWKNGVATNLSSNTSFAIAYSIGLSGNEIVIAGQESVGHDNMTKYWINSSQVSLTHNGGQVAMPVGIYIKSK